MPLRLVRIIGCVAAILGAGCPRVDGPDAYLVVAPDEMSRHAAAMLVAYPMAEEEPTRPVTVTPLLVPPECAVEVLTPEATTNPRVRISADVAGPCSFALLFDDGRSSWRVDHSIRFLDVPTLLPIEGAHWLDACPGATVADRAGDRVACGTASTTTVDEGGESSTLAARLKATDGDGGWVACADDTCRLRGRDRGWHVIQVEQAARGAWMPLHDPEDTFVAGLGTEAPLLVSRVDGRVSPLPNWTSDFMYCFAAGGRLVSATKRIDDESWSWVGWRAGAWEPFPEDGPAPIPVTELPEAVVAGVGGGASALEVDATSWRLSLHALQQPADSLLRARARGLEGTHLFLFDEFTVLRLVRLTDRGLTTLALAPILDGDPWYADPLAGVLVTEDAVVLTPTAGGEPLRLRVGP